MEGLWFVVVISASIALGLQGFVHKIIVEKKHPRPVSLFVFYAFQIPLFGIAWFVIGSEPSFFLTGMGVLFGAVNFLLLHTIFIALAHIPTSLYFIVSRIATSLALLLIGSWFFGDELTYTEYIGFFVGFIVFWLLIEKGKVQKTNYRVGLYALACSVFLLIAGHTIVKYTAHQVENIFYVHTVVSLVGALLTLCWRPREIFQTNPRLKEIVTWGALYGALYAFTINIVYAAYRGHDLAITFKILSYSLIITIMLSSITYKEKLGPKKILAIVFTVISLWFFF